MTYEFECKNKKCMGRETLTMTLSEFEEYKEGKKEIRCRKCDSPVRVVIGTPGVNLGQGFSRRAF